MGSILGECIHGIYSGLWEPIIHLRIRDSDFHPPARKSSMPASSSSNSSNGSGTGRGNGRGRGRGRGNGRGGRYALANGGNLCSAHNGCAQCSSTVSDLRSKLGSARANAKRTAAMCNYLRETLELMENGGHDSSNSSLFATSGNQFLLNTCAEDSDGDIEGMMPCGVCFSKYTKGGDHNPVMFFSEGCGHTVCKACFLKMRGVAVSEQENVTCPYCRRVVTRAACVRM